MFGSRDSAPDPAGGLAPLPPPPPPPYPQLVLSLPAAALASTHCQGQLHVTIKWSPHTDRRLCPRAILCHRCDCYTRLTLTHFAISTRSVARKAIAGLTPADVFVARLTLSHHAGCTENDSRINLRFKGSPKSRTRQVS